MEFNPALQSATLIKRYKRFLADITLPDGSTTTIHCANTGAMSGCAEPGNRIWYSTSDNPKRKYPFSWELTETSAGDRICINTARANQLVIEAIKEQRIPELSGYDTVRPEVKYGQENSRIDILLQKEGQPDCYVEVKSVTLLGEGGQGFFPDAKTLRGQKHLRELTEMAQQGARAVLFYSVQHSGIENVSPATHIDPTYSTLIEQAIAAGVEVICYRATLTHKSMLLSTPLQFTL
jgi:sugar fermentation stimulation protein A